MTHKFKCNADVSERTGLYSYACGKPAKRYYTTMIYANCGNAVEAVKNYRCGLHSRDKRRQWIEVKE